MNIDIKCTPFVMASFERIFSSWTLCASMLFAEKDLTVGAISDEVH